MKKCPKCGFENEMGGIDCPQCGIVYAKFDAIQQKSAENQSAVEPGASDSAPDTEPSQEELPEALQMLDYDESKSFDWIRIKDAVIQFVMDNRKWLIAGVGVCCVIMFGVVIATSGLKGKRGTVSWTQLLGEEAESDLLFDYIELLPDPELTEESEDTEYRESICDMPSGTSVQVLSVQDDFLEIEVLSGECSGEVGYIMVEQFERN